jgi:hypothetical protein
MKVIQMTQAKTNQQVLKEVAAAIESLRFGSIEITLHDGRVTQIERREKVRFADNTKTESSPTAPAAAKNFRYA